mmetsp:Transcript_88109/g.273849  ORF Transcript_88109/g.273849 Transcript_88109/m.273849 type:complete len:222 (-) Transcript_88109:464-1129(-)
MVIHAPVAGGAAEPAEPRDVPVRGEPWPERPPACVELGANDGVVLEDKPHLVPRQQLARVLPQPPEDLQVAEGAAGHAPPPLDGRVGSLAEAPPAHGLELRVVPGLRRVHGADALHGEVERPLPEARLRGEVLAKAPQLGFHPVPAPLVPVEIDVEGAGDPWSWGLVPQGPGLAAQGGDLIAVALTLAVLVPYGRHAGLRWRPRCCRRGGSCQLRGACALA